MMKTIKVSRKSPVTGVINERYFDVKPADWIYFNSSDRPPVQECFPYLSADDREFLITGMTPEDWEKAFGRCD